MANDKYIIPEEYLQMVAVPAAEYATALSMPIPAQITVTIEDVPRISTRMLINAEGDECATFFR